MTVIPLRKGPIRGDLTYFTGKEINNGSIVEIFVRNTKTLGLVLDSENVTESKTDIKEMDFNLKKIIEVKERSIWTNEYIESILLAARYFAARKNDAAAALIPSIFREEYDKLAKIVASSLPREVDREKLKSEKLIFQAPYQERMSYYKTLIRSTFAQKKSVFIVLPTEQDIENYYELLSRGVEKFSFFLHSGLSKKKILEKFETIMTSDHPMLILGTAPFLSIPRHDLGVIVLEHESANAYKNIGTPPLDLRLFTEIFAQKIKAKFILADTILRFETIERKEAEDLVPVHPLSFRTDFEGEITVVNTKADKEKGGFKIFSDLALSEITLAIKKSKSVFVFSLRKGLGNMTVCRDCGNTLLCDKCSAPLVLYLSRDGQKRMFACNRCKNQKDATTFCDNCGSWNLMPLGIGTDLVYEKLKEILPPQIKIFKLDKESAKTPAGAKKIIKNFEECPGSVLVGTEMALFYMKNKVALSVVASFDSLWSVPSYRISEKIVSIIIGITNKTFGTFILQTKNPDDPAIRAATNANLLNFIREELKDRKELGYPPFKRFIKIVHMGNREEMTRAREALQRIFSEYNPEIFSGFVAKLKDKYATNTLIKLEPSKWSLREIVIGGKLDENLLRKLLALPPMFHIFVDPEDLL